MPNAKQFENASESFRRLNPGLYHLDQLPSTKREPRQVAPLEYKALGEKQGGRGMETSTPRKPCIAFVVYRRRLVDTDNLVASCKGLRDSISEWLGTDDADRFVRWSYVQIKTKRAEGVIVKLEYAYET